MISPEQRKFDSSHYQKDSDKAYMAQNVDMLAEIDSPEDEGVLEKSSWSLLSHFCVQIK